MPSFGSNLRIVVTGLVGLHPVGGVAWDYLQYVMGFYRLGHDVYYFEDTWSWPYHPIKKSQVAEGDYSAKFIDSFFSTYMPECKDRWQYFHLHESPFGISRMKMKEVLSTADLYINVSGANLFPEELPAKCVKVFLDTDPGYNQIVMSERFDWSENVDRWCENIKAHDFHFTYAENIHSADCKVPKLGIDWQSTRMPVVMDLWATDIKPYTGDGAAWSTVMTWNAFKGPVIYKGIEYRSKGAEFEKLVNIPALFDIPFRVAVGGIEAPLTRLSDAGWIVEDGPSISLTPSDYQEYIWRSRGELSTAKHIYVALRTGWFSCRSACYLAAGRPVVLQDTGFSSRFPVGEGLLVFNTFTEAAEAIREIESNYSRHQDAAQSIAEEYFASDKVLNKMLDDINLV